MPKPYVPPAPPSLQTRLTIAECPICHRPAFSREARHPAILAGQVPRIERLTIECPWCLTATYMDPEKGLVTAVLALDFAAQIRQGLTSGVLPEQIEAGKDAITGGERDEAEAGTEADEAGDRT